MRIGVIGAGNVGGTLGSAWVKNGHDVLFGVPDPTAPKMLDLLKATGGKARAGSVAQAAAHGEVVVFATPWPATQDAVRRAGDLTGKVILDCTNPLKEDLSGLAVGHTTSGAEQVAAWASSTRVVKVFNTTGFENMARPSYSGTSITMFFAGDDGGAKKVAAQLAQEVGFDPLDAGPLANARLLEPLGFLWIYLALKQGHGTGIAYQLMHRQDMPKVRPISTMTSGGGHEQGTIGSV
jgi:8-hydroxy-5-deazaflavin:NADPH oxidoreductase